jgi:hypothetical protein
MPDALYRILAYMGAVALLVGFGAYLGYDYADAKAAAAAKASLERAREVERQWQDTFNTNARHLTNELNTIASGRDAALERLRRERAQRMPTASGNQQSCENRPGLDWRHGEDFERAAIDFAAGAARQQAALKECYADLEALR